MRFVYLNPLWPLMNIMKYRFKATYKKLQLYLRKVTIFWNLSIRPIGIVLITRCKIYACNWFWNWRDTFLLHGNSDNIFRYIYNNRWSMRLYAFWWVGWQYMYLISRHYKICVWQYQYLIPMNVYECTRYVGWKYSIWK